VHAQRVMVLFVCRCVHLLTDYSSRYAGTYGFRMILSHFSLLDFWLYSQLVVSFGYHYSLWCYFRNP